MAQRRMINKKISINEDIAGLDIKAQLLFTWMIPHADDLGLLPFSARTIKALVVPMWDDTADEIGTLLEDIWKTGVVEVIEINGERFIHLKSFDENQTLKKDRQPQTVLKLKLKDNAKESWTHLEDTWNTHGIIAVPFGNQKFPEEKGREGNLREEKRREVSGTSLPEEKKEGILDTRPKEAGPLAETLKDRFNFYGPEKSGSATEHQVKAFEYAKKLGIELKGSDTGRWIKIFKQAAGGRNTANLEKAYSYCKDHSGWFEMDNIARMNLFFYIFENGLKNISQL